MNVYIIDNDSDCIDPLQAMLELYDVNWTTDNYKKINQAHAKQAELVVLSGGVWYQDPTDHAKHYSRELEFILKTKIPTLGICLGMQLIAADFGAEFEDLESRVSGPKMINFTSSGQELYGVSELEVEENHTITLSKTPVGFSELAKSVDGPEIIKHNSRPIMGVQFHPELSRPDKATSLKFWQETLTVLGLGAR